MKNNPGAPGASDAFDARHDVPRIGPVIQAQGRDVATTTSFGKNTLDWFTVWTDEVTDRGLL